MLASRSAVRAPRVSAKGRSRPTVVRVAAVVSKGELKAAVSKEELMAAKDEVAQLIGSTAANPILVRLGWHDSGSKTGATGSIRFKPEMSHGANAGLQAAVDMLEPIKARHPSVSYADLFQMASAVGVELAGGPKIPLRYGRKDAESEAECAPEGFLPDAGHPFSDGSTTPGEHLRRVFGRMGFNDMEIVALSGAHTIGRARPERSGWGQAETTYTKLGPGKPGGQSWTVEWLKFDNSYFTEVKAKRDEQLLVLPTDAALFEDEGFRPYAEKYAADEAAFFEDYAKAHIKLSELGVTWVEGAPMTL